MRRALGARDCLLLTAYFRLFRHQRQARPLASATGFGADAAVLHVRRVLFAFGGADAARLGARPQLPADELLVRRGEARDDARGGEADVAAIEVGPDAGDLLRDFLFPLAGVGASVARFRTGVTGGDAFNGHAAVRGGIVRVGGEHLLDVAHVKRSLPPPAARGGNESGEGMIRGRLLNLTLAPLNPLSGARFRLRVGARVRLRACPSPPLALHPATTETPREP
jgi:hypothetical protein